MKLKPKSYAESLLAICKGKTTAEIDICVKEFLAYLSRSRGLRIGTAILEALRDCVARQSGSRRITLTSAQVLETSERETFEKMIHESFGKKSSITFSVDQHLLGGFRIKTDDLLVDGSLAGRLHALRDHLKQSAIIN